MSPSPQSNDRFDLDRTTSNAGGDALTPETSVNARFLAYLQQVYAPRDPRRLSVMTASIIAAALLLALAALALIKEVHAVWPLLPLGVALVVRGALALHRRLGTRHRLIRVRDVIESGVPVTGYLVQANSALFCPGTDNLSCLALFSLQPEVGEDAHYMRHLAARVYSYKNTEPLTGEGRYLASLTSDAEPVLYRRRMLPFSLTDGSTVFCADVWVNRAYIKNGYLSDDTLPLLAAPTEGVELIPWWLADSEAKPLAAPCAGEKIERFQPDCR